MTMLQVGMGDSGGYQIPRSLRFRSSASAYLSRTLGSAGNRKTWTWSGWVKRGVLSTFQTIFQCAADTSNETTIGLMDDNRIYFANRIATVDTIAYTAAVLRDPSAWYHLSVSCDTTQATSADRLKIYLNGQLQTLTGAYVAQNTDTFVNSAQGHRIGINQALGTRYLDGYLSEVNFIDGQALDPTSFGETSATTGQWQAKKYTGTYGTNGFYLPFSDTTSTTTLCYDASGNANHWTATNISLTAGATYDSMTDVPLGGGGSLGNGQGNYCVLNPLDKGANVTVSEGNLKFTVSTAANAGGVRGTVKCDGKIYFEGKWTATAGGAVEIGVATNAATLTTGSSAGQYTYVSSTGNKVLNGSATAYGGTWSINDIIGVAYDSATGNLEFFKNNTSQGVISTGLSGTDVLPFVCDSSSLVQTMEMNFGQRPFAYTPPTGFKALHTGNLSAPAIAKPNEHFDAKTHTGNNTTLNITGVAFRPDFAWVKSRSNAYSNIIMDSVRGAGKLLTSDTTSAETGNAGDLITAFNSDGITVNTTYLGGANASTNGNASTFVDWLWKAGGTGVSNTNGTITSTVSANTTAGFSIVTYTGTGANATVGHGLGVAPKMVIVKGRTSAFDWPIYHAGNGATPQNNGVYLSATNASAANIAFWNNTAPTSSVFSIGNGTGVNSNTVNHVAYCFAEIAGFSKFGSYTANNSADGPFVYCGFRPKFLLVKASSIAGEWYLLDSSRDAYNLTQNRLFANSSIAESASSTNGPVDFLSNGFKVRSAAANNNNNGSDTYIFAAFAEAPFQSALAR